MHDGEIVTFFRITMMFKDMAATFWGTEQWIHFSLSPNWESWLFDCLMLALKPCPEFYKWSIWKMLYRLFLYVLFFHWAVCQSLPQQWALILGNSKAIYWAQLLQQEVEVVSIVQSKEWEHRRRQRKKVLRKARQEHCPLSCVHNYVTSP